jgi:hypothetical protein
VNRADPSINLALHQFLQSSAISCEVAVGEGVVFLKTFSFRWSQRRRATSKTSESNAACLGLGTDLRERSHQAVKAAS